jgi:hypothetical protein
MYESLGGALTMSPRPIVFLLSLWCALFCASIFSGSALATGNAGTSFSQRQASTLARRALTLPASHSGSSDQPITISSETYTLHFPTSIDFTLTARDSQSTISAARLFIQFKDAVFSQDMEQHNISIARPARVITLHYHEDTRDANFHYPGTPVQYSWTLQDKANNQYTSPASNFTTLDTRFSWRHVAQGLLNVYWYNRPADFGQTLLNRARAAISHSSKKLGGALLHNINVWIYASPEDFHGALAPGSYEWIGGEAHPDLNEAFISAVDDQDTTLVRDLPHELSHLVLHQLVAQGIGDYVPRWFDEGMAVYNQFYHEPEMQFRLNQALARHDLLRLGDITSQFPANGDSAFLAYAQSWNLVSYMFKTFGQAKMAALVRHMNNAQASFDDDLTQALGEDQLHLENSWRLQLNQPPVVAAYQLTPAPTPVAHLLQPQSPPLDNTAPLLITLGGALIVLPILGVAALLLYQRGRRRREWSVQNARQVMAAGFAQPGQPAQPRRQEPYLPFAFDPPENPYERPNTGEIPRIAQQPGPWQFEHPASYFRKQANSEERKDAPQE